MLVRTSDQMEDVVDMSSDNLLALKEQATNTDMDTILRCIRIFSELSSKMRYATQKRILIEMEFIKICKPQMEDTRDSIEDRIRILEEHTAKADKVLSGIKSGKIAVAAAPGQSVSAPVEVKKLDHAVPDDIKRIVNEWGKYMMNMPQPDRGYLKNARLSIDNDDKLLIVIDNKTLAEHYHEEQYYQNLERFFEEQMGKQVDFEVRYLESEKRFEENYIDLASINFDIITEEEVSIPTTQETATDIEEVSVSADVPEDISKDAFAEDDTVQPISTDGLAEGFDAINLDIDEEEDIIPPEALALSGAMQEDAMDDENAFEEKDDDDNQNE